MNARPNFVMIACICFAFLMVALNIIYIVAPYPLYAILAGLFIVSARYNIRPRLTEKWELKNIFFSKTFYCGTILIFAGILGMLVSYLPGWLYAMPSVLGVTFLFTAKDPVTV